MRARAVVHARNVDGRTAFTTLRSDPPLVLRQAAGALYVVGGAGGPLGGDEVGLDICVDAGASLCMHSAAATLAQPGPHGECSRATTRVHVAEGACFVWRPEPIVSVRRSDHVVDTEIDLAAGASLVARDELVLGRAGEEPGRLRVRCRVRRDGRPLFAHDVDLGDGAVGWASGAVLGSGRALVSELLVGAAAPDKALSTRDGDARAALLPLASGAALWMAVAPRLAAARALLDATRDDCRPATADRHARHGGGGIEDPSEHRGG